MRRRKSRLASAPKQPGAGGSRRPAFAPVAEFELTGGADALTDYQFGKRSIHHLFCSRCGIRSFARGAMPDGREMVAVHVRCLDGVDPGAFPIRAFDGKSLPLGA